MPPIDDILAMLDDINDRMESLFPSCQINEIDILQHLPKCECIDVVSVTFQKPNGIGFDYLLCKEHIDLILAIRKANKGGE
jgi:hypothetical protein